MAGFDKTSEHHVYFVIVRDGEFLVGNSLPVTSANVKHMWNPILRYARGFSNLETAEAEAMHIKKILKATPIEVVEVDLAVDYTIRSSL